MEEVLADAASHNETREDKQIPEVNTQLGSRRGLRPQTRRPHNLTFATLQNYASCRKKFLAWCTEQNFSDGCWVREEKIIAFCQDELIAKGRFRGRKTGPPTPYSRSGVASYITACMHLYYEQVREGLHNYSNPRSSRYLAALLKNLKRLRGDNRLNFSRTRSCSTPVDDQTQNGTDSPENCRDGNGGSGAEDLHPQIIPVPGMSELTNMMNALYNATMARIDGMENNISSLQTSISRTIQPAHRLHPTIPPIPMICSIWIHCLTHFGRNWRIAQADIINK
ncbi:hypothetical protein DFS34DRAFT_647206 [Phlyctochytrium arcticum]|nr:hypothetical protein DFS34DRAFT_647206 [Phlyctochytrium arcticum]